MASNRVSLLCRPAVAPGPPRRLAPVCSPERLRQRSCAASLRAASATSSADHCDDRQSAAPLALNNAYVLTMAAKERLAVGDWKESLRLLNLAISIDPFQTFSFSTRGLLFQRINRTSDAKKDFHRVLEISPGYPRTHSRI